MRSRWDYDVTESLNTQTSFGGQYYQKKEQSRGSLGLVFPTGVVTTISGAATTSADEDFVENVTAGVYIQEQLGWNDRLFLTGAVRWDDNSAFGENFDAAVYPKLSGTWVISEEDFFDVGMINQLRLRSAWGKSGRQPDIFAAQRFYDPNTGPGGVSVLTPGTIGNPDLKPETSSEIEVGADLSMFDDRLSASFTYYDRTTKDAILQRWYPDFPRLPRESVHQRGRGEGLGHGAPDRTRHSHDQLVRLELGRHLLDDGERNCRSRRADVHTSGP